MYNVKLSTGFNLSWIFLSVILLGAVFLCPRVSAQHTESIQSLEKSLPLAENDSVRVHILIKMGAIAMRHKPTRATFHLKQAINLSHEIQYHNGEILATRLLGQFYENQGNHKEAIDVFNQARDISNRHQGNRELIPELFLDIARNFEFQFNFQESIYYYFKAAQQFASYGQDEGNLRALFPLIRVLFQIEKYEKAQNYAREAILLAYQTQDTSRIIKALNAYTLATHHIKPAPEVLDSLKKGLALHKKFSPNNDTLRIDLLITKGEVLAGLEQFQESENTLIQSLELANTLQMKKKESSSYYQLARLYASQELWQQSIYYGKKALEIMGEDPNREMLLGYYKHLSDVHAKARNFESALEYSRLHIRLQDSINNYNISEAVRNHEILYEYQKQETQLGELLDEQERRRRTIYFLVGGFLIVMVLSYFLYRSLKHYQKMNNLLQQRNTQISNQNDKIIRQKEKIEIQNTSLGQALKELEIKNDQLIKLDNEKNDLIKVVAHDLRSPINQVRGLLEIIRTSQEIGVTEQKQYIDLANEVLVRLDHMINRILDINTLDKEKRNPELETLDLAYIIQDIIKVYQPNAKAKDISIISNLENNYFYANLDESYTRQIFENILSNALKYTPSGKRIFIYLEEEEEHIRVLFKDEGPGFTEKDKKLLFRKFQKLSARPTGGEPSTGLGLSIIKKYVELQNGTVEVESEYGQGACFIVIFQKASGPTSINSSELQKTN